MYGRKNKRADDNPNKIAEEIAELLAKIQLLEGDRKAFAESTQFTSKCNEAKISGLRKETKELMLQYKKCASCDDETLDLVFPGHDIGKQPFVGKHPEQIISGLQDKKCDQMKRLNQYQYKTKEKEKELVQLIEKMKSIHDFADYMNRADQEPKSQKAKNRRILTDLEKYKMKNIEADEVRKYFAKLARRLGEENKLYESNLEYLEKAIKDNEDDLQCLKEMNKDAEESKEAARKDLQFQEEQIMRDKQFREKQKSSIKRVSDIRLSEYSKINDLIAQQEEKNKKLSEVDELSEYDREQQHKAEIAEQKISSVEKACQKIKAGTGLSSMEEAIKHFESQFKTKDNLESQIDRNAELISELEQRKRELNENFDDLRFQGNDVDDETSYISPQGSDFSESGSEDLDEVHMSIAQKKLSLAQETVANMKLAIDHLYDKLLEVKSFTQSKRPSWERNKEHEYLKDVLSICNEKIHFLVNEVGADTDIDQVLQEIEQSDFNEVVHKKLTTANTRVSTKGAPIFDQSDDEEILESDDEDIVSRTDVKRASKALIDSKTNKRGNKRAAMKFR